MSTKSSSFYDDKTDIHVYHELLDGKYYLTCNDAILEVNEKIAKEFEKLDIAYSGRVCPNCGCELE